MITTEIVWDLRNSDSLDLQWAELDDLGLCEPSTSLAWTRALLATHVAESDTTFAVVLSDGGQTVAIIPAVIRTERVMRSLDVATLYLLCDLTTAHSDILRVSGRPDIVPAVIDALTGLTGRWDMLRIARLIESSPVALQVTSHLARGTLPHRERREQPSFYLELEESYELFLAGRSAKFRNYLRRKTRQLEAEGKLRILKAGPDLDVEQAFGHLLSIEERSWKHAHGTAISAVPHQQTFYRLLCEGAHRTGRLHLMLMYLNDVPIAFNLGVTAAARYSYLKTSFDEAYRKLSPATILRASLVEMLIRDGVRCLDFPAEPYQWEEQWTDTVRWHTSVVVFNRTARGALLRLLVTSRDRLRRSRKDDGIAYVDPRRNAVT